MNSFEFLNFLNQFKKTIQKNEYMEKVRNKARDSFIKRIGGYEFDEITKDVKMVPDPSGKGKKLKEEHIKTIKRHVPPSDTCIIFGLKNSDPENFQDKVTSDVNVRKDMPSIIEKLETSDLLEMEKEINEIQDKYTQKAIQSEMEKEDYDEDE